MRFLVAGFTGAIVALVAGIIIAIVTHPFVTPYLSAFMRPEADGILWPSLLSGYLVIGYALAYIAPKMSVEQMSLSQVLTVGMIIGLAVFLGGHLLTTGWSVLPVGVMAVSGVVDSFFVALAFWSVSFVYRRYSTVHRG